MFEKVNPRHPDKVADRIAGAIVDLAYRREANPRIAVEVLLGHGVCTVIAESSGMIWRGDVADIVRRIVGDQISLDFLGVPQDAHLAANQKDTFRCGDNGIFKGVPVTDEQRELARIAKEIYAKYPYDGKYILDGDRLIICQSNARTEDLKKDYPNAVINPLGDWTGGIGVDSGATNRKLGSDMADSVTGGGLCISGDSEYLGSDLKWHRMDEYDGGEIAQWTDGKLEFVEPSRYIRNESDTFIRIYNDTKLDMMLTPYHNVLIKTSKGNYVKRPAFLVAQKLDDGIGNSGSIVHSFNFENQRNGKSTYEDDANYRLQVAFCADGTLLGETNKTWNGRIRVKKDDKKARLRKLLEGKKHKETSDGEYSIFWYHFAKESKSLFDCFANEDWTVLRDEIFAWDGDRRRKVFRTTKKEDADFIQLVFASAGLVSTISKDDRIRRMRNQDNRQYEVKSVLYTVHLLNSTTTQLRETKGCRIHVDYKQEKFPSYCFEVPSHNFIVRYNDKIFITGNCGKDLSKADVSVNIYAWLKAQETNAPVCLSCAIGDETVDGKPYSEIVAIARDYIRKIGGFEKFAEWGLVR